MPTEDEMRRIVIEEIERNGGTYFGPRPTPRPYEPAPPLTAKDIFQLSLLILVCLAGVGAVFWYWGIWWAIGAAVVLVLMGIGFVTDS